MIKRNPLQLKNDFKLGKFEPYACSPFDKKPKAAKDVTSPLYLIA